MTKITRHTASQALSDMCKAGCCCAWQVSGWLCLWNVSRCRQRCVGI